MSTGVSASDECMAAYHALRSQKKGRYVMMKFNATKTEVIVEKVGDRANTISDLVSELKTEGNDICRYVIFDFEYEAEDGSPRDKLLFIVWAPDTAKIKEKMLTAGTKVSFAKTLDLTAGCSEIQANDLDAFEIDELMKKVSTR